MRVVNGKPEREFDATVASNNQAEIKDDDQTVIVVEATYTVTVGEMLRWLYRVSGQRPDVESVRANFNAMVRDQFDVITDGLEQALAVTEPVKGIMGLRLEGLAIDTMSSSDHTADLYGDIAQAMTFGYKNRVETVKSLLGPDATLDINMDEGARALLESAAAFEDVSPDDIIGDDPPDS